MTDIAPFLFEAAESAPIVPSMGRFLLPLCITEEELHILLGAALYYAEVDACHEVRHLIPLMQAMEYIGQVEYAACMGFFEDLTEPECDNYLPYAPFADYWPMNPYNDPDTVPDGYLVPPFTRNTDLEYPEIFGYKASDIFVPFAAINIAPETILTLNYPQIKITVRGSGQIELDLLSVQLGGFAVIKVGSPPNIGDILGEIVIETGLRIIDLDNDSASIPPETDIVIAEEINIEAAVNETTDVYVVFLPKINDQLPPAGFGGGIRSIGLCGFEQDAIMAGIEDVRYNELTGGLDKRIEGVWAEFATCEQLVACAPEGGGGGGGAAAIKTTNVSFAATPFVTTSSSYVNAGNAFSFTPAYSKMLVICHNMIMSNTAGGAAVANARITFNGVGGDSAQNGTAIGNTQRIIAVSENFTGMTVGVAHNIAIELKTGGSGTAAFSAAHTLQFTIIEFDDLSALFVEDVRIVGREIQKKIGGVWLTVTDSLDAILDSIDSQISSIVATNVSQQNTINTHTSQISILNSTTALHTSQIADHETRIDSLEGDMNDVESDVIAIQVLNATQNTRLSSLETNVNGMEILVGKMAFGGVWAQNHSLNSSSYFWSMLIGTGYVAGEGFRSNSNGLTLSLSDARLDENQVTHVYAGIKMLSAPTGSLQWRVNGSAYGSLNYVGVGGISEGWLRVPNVAGTTFQIEFLGFGDFYLRTLYFLGRGENNPFA
jgi:hypothetical protein